MTSEVIGSDALLGLGPQDRDAGLEVRRRQVRDEAPFEAAAQPLLEGQDRLRRPVRGQDDLLAVLVDRVERVEELFLRPLLVGDELDVVDEQEVDPPVAGAELVDLALLDRGDELVGELLGRGVDDALARELGDDLVADGVHQVGLAEAHAAVQEERVVGVARALRHGQAGRVGEAVGRPDDEVAEGVARVDVGRAALAADAGRLDADLLGRRAGRRRRLERVAAGAVRRRGGALGRCRHDELHLDAVADDPREGLADQRAVAGLEPVLGEPVGDADLEALVIDVHQLGIAQPGLVIGGRQRHLQLAECRSPDLLRVHSFDLTCVDVGRGWVALAKGPKRKPGALERCSRRPSAPEMLRPRDPDRQGSPGRPAGVPAPKGSERIAPADRAVARRSCNTPGEYLCVDA